MSQDLIESIFQKAVVIREGSSLRTAEELTQVFFADAQFLLQSQKLETQGRELDGDDIPDYESFLANAGYTVVWDDGFVIYKDLGTLELDYIREF